MLLQQVVSWSYITIRQVMPKKISVTVCRVPSTMLGRGKKASNGRALEGMRMQFEQSLLPGQVGTCIA